VLYNESGREKNTLLVGVGDGSNRNVLLEAICNRKDSNKAVHALHPVSSSSSFSQALPTGAEMGLGRSALLLAIQERGEKLELKNEIADVPWPPDQSIESPK